MSFFNFFLMKASLSQSGQVEIKIEYLYLLPTTLYLRAWHCSIVGPVFELIFLSNFAGIGAQSSDLDLRLTIIIFYETNSTLKTLFLLHWRPLIEQNGFFWVILHNIFNLLLYLNLLPRSKQLSLPSIGLPWWQCIRVLVRLLDPPENVTNTNKMEYLSSVCTTKWVRELTDLSLNKSRYLLMLAFNLNYLNQMQITGRFGVGWTLLFSMYWYGIAVRFPEIFWLWTL